MRWQRPSLSIRRPILGSIKTCHAPHRHRCWPDRREVGAQVERRGGGLYHSARSERSTQRGAASGAQHHMTSIATIEGCCTPSHGPYPLRAAMVRRAREALSTVTCSRLIGRAIEAVFDAAWGQISAAPPTARRDCRTSSLPVRPWRAPFGGDLRAEACEILVRGADRKGHGACQRSEAALDHLTAPPCCADKERGPVRQGGPRTPERRPRCEDQAQQHARDCL